MTISQVEVINVRGIPGKLSLRFTSNDGKPCSAFLYGDNGSGKSSIVDAIEFALRGRLSRRGIQAKKVRREVRNLVASGPPGVTVQLSTGELLVRGGGFATASAPDLRSAYVPGFDKCPIVIRRHDVENFWSIPASARQEFFFDYLREPGDYRDAQQIVKERQSALRNAERSLLSTASALKAQIRRDDLPTSAAATRVYYKRVLLRQYGVGVGRERKVPAKTYRAFLFYQEALRKVERLREEQGNPVPDLTSDTLATTLSQASQRISEDFLAVTGYSWIEGVELDVDVDGKRLEIAVRLRNRKGPIEPTQLLSEAALDLLAVLVLVEMHLQCATLGQRKFIILDDVFQSVDSIHRVQALRHILQRLSGWQFIITLHDRLWLELAQVAAMGAGHRSPAVLRLVRNDFSSPPSVRSGSQGSRDELAELLGAGRASPGLITAASGRALEDLCDRLSVSLGTSVTRRRGDKYTLGDLWPGIMSRLKKYGGPALAEVADEVQRHLSLRNIAGAHYNEWATSLSDSESANFARSVLNIWNSCICESCWSPLSAFTASTGSAVILRFPCKCAARAIVLSRPEASTEC